MGINPAVLTKFKPYVGLVDDKAIGALKKTPLVLTQPEMDALVKNFKEANILNSQEMIEFFNKNQWVKFLSMADQRKNITKKN